MSASPAADPHPTPLPRVFGRYVLFDHVGRGGMAEIFLARAKTTEAGGARLVVVKQILRELSDDPKFSEALVAEAKLASRLSHANVVQVLDLGRGPTDVGDPAGKDGRLFITMEYVEGLDLNELLRRCARQRVALPLEFALLIVMETLRGLDYAHRRVGDDGKPLGIVHRDVSPSNVLVSVDGEVKVCDFGIARANSDATDKLADETIQGKAGYMSPEHANGQPLDARADVFAAGVILWELLAGRRLYRADKEHGESLLAVARRAEIPELPRRGLANEDELHAIAKKALSRSRDERYESAAAMLAELQAHVAKSKLIASPIRLGEWLTEHFGQELIATRRARERAVRALESGPVAVITPMAPATKPAEAPARIEETPLPAEPRPLPPVAEKASSASEPERLAALDPAPPKPVPSSMRYLFAAVLIAVVGAVLFLVARR